ncbi:MAG: TldD/PmbA family protein [Bacteriovoracaceae bacterium]
MSSIWKDIFNTSSTLLFKNLNEDETLSLELSAEETNFIRFNSGKVRQGTKVEQGDLVLSLFWNGKTTSLTMPLSLNQEQNEKALKVNLERLQSEVKTLPDDPHIVMPTKGEESNTVINGELPSAEEFIGLVKETTSGFDLAGYLTSGVVIRAMANSLGQNHWFETESFFFDYSLYTAKEKAIKGNYAGSHFSKDEFLINLNNSKEALAVMDIEQVELKPGSYRVYLAPSAVNEISSMLSWHALSGGAYKKGECPLSDLKDERKFLSKKFSMKENFKMGVTPRFNKWGEVSDDELPIVINGKLENLLVSKETEKEYGLKSNKADSSEAPRSLEIQTGTLKRDEIFSKLGDGIYVSDLHYLNWSDKNNARLTGMTRFGCLKVENGKVVGPIKDLRFDETLYQIFGDDLEEVTEFSETMVSTGTYSQRSLGGAKLPGMLLKGFTFTL